MSLDMKVIKKREHICIIEVKGSLDTETHQDLKNKLDEIVSESTKVIIVDMKGVNYISSAGIGVIMAAKKSLKQKHISFAMIDLQPQIEKVFEAMKILPMVDIFRDMPEADKYIDQIIQEEIKKQNA